MVLKLVMYNSHDMGAGKIELLWYLCSTNDFVVLKECWLFDNQIFNIAKSFANCNIIGTSGMNECELITSRPLVAVPLFEKKSLKCKVMPIKSESKRFNNFNVDFACTK